MLYNSYICVEQMPIHLCHSASENYGPTWTHIAQKMVTMVTKFTMTVSQNTAVLPDTTKPLPELI